MINETRNSSKEISNEKDKMKIICYEKAYSWVGVTTVYLKAKQYSVGGIYTALKFFK